MNALESYERSHPAERSPSWLEIACAWALVIIVVCALAPQPVKQIGLYPLVAAQSAIQTGLCEPIGLAGRDQPAGVSVR